MIGYWTVTVYVSFLTCSHLTRKLIPLPVGLPNGNIVVTKLIGNVNFPDSIMLIDVLYLPLFNFYFISVSKLARPFIFSDKKCLIQDGMQDDWLG